MKKRWITAGMVVLGLGASAAWWLARGGDSKGILPRVFAASGTKSAEEDAKKNVPLEFLPSEITRPARAALDQTIQFSGPLVAPRQAQIRAKAPGRLLSLRVAEGDRVRAGQTLGVQDLADLASRVAERSAMVESAKAALQQAERVHAQNERLFAQGFIAAAALDVSRSAVQTAQAQVDAAIASLNSTRVALRDGSIQAPIAGIVAKRLALPGEMLSAEQPVLTIVDLAQLELAGMVASHEVSKLAVGMTVVVRVEGHDSTVEGHLARIAPAAEPGTRAIAVAIGMANPHERYKAGQYAVASVSLKDPEQRLVLPVSAVAAVAGNNHVWTISEGKLMRRTVMLGRKDDAGGRVEVREGIPADATVVAARFDNLREGAPALIVPAARASAAAPAPVTR